MHGMHPHMVIGNDKDGVKGKTLDRSTMRRVFSLAGRYRTLLIGFVGALLLSSLISIVPALLVRSIIDDAIPNRDSGQVNTMALLMALIAFAAGAISLLERWFSARIGEKLIFDLRVQLFDHVQRMPIDFFTRTQTGALISRMNNDVIGAQRALTGTLGQVISNLIVLGTTLITMFILEWRLPLLALLLLPFFLIPTKRVGRVLQGLTREQMTHNAEMNTTMTERLNVAGALLVKLFGRHDDERDGFADRAGAVRDLGIRSAMYGRAFTIGLTIVGALGTAIVYWVGGRLAIGDVGEALSVGTVVAMGLYVSQIYMPLTGLTNARVDIMTAMVSFERVFEVLDTQNAITDAPDATELANPAGRIVVTNVSFAYPSESNAPASLEAGPVSNGPAARSRRWCCATSASSFNPAKRSRWSDRRGRESRPWCRCSHGCTTSPQASSASTVMTFASFAKRRCALPSVWSARTRICSMTALGRTCVTRRPQATDAELRAACEAAQILEVIEALPNGFDTVVGERGYRLSGGEKQRLAIARMLLKDPAIVVLDEATSHLDSENEYLVQQALAAALDGRAAIIIAHRLSTIVSADVILVLDRGVVVQRGTHRELLESGGLYSELYQTLVRGETATPAAS